MKKLVKNVLVGLALLITQQSLAIETLVLNGKAKDGKYKVVYGEMKSGTAQIVCGSESFVLINRKIRIPMENNSICLHAQVTAAEKIATHDIYISTDATKTTIMPEFNKSKQNERAKEQFLNNLLALNSARLNYEKDDSAKNEWELHEATGAYENSAQKAFNIAEPSNAGHLQASAQVGKKLKVK